MDTTELVAQIAESLDPGSFVTKFVIVVEVIDAAGKRDVYVDAQEGATRWDTYGLLTEALETEKAHHHAEARDGDSDE